MSLRRIKDRVMNNILLKLISLTIAISLWLIVVVKGQTEITLTVPVEFRNLPQGLGILSKSNSTVEVSIKGFEQIIKNMRPYDVKMSVDLSRVKKGSNTIYLTKESVRLPSSLTVSSIRPEYIKIVTEEIVRKRIPVKPFITGSPLKGYFIRDVRIEPSFIEIEGLKSQLSKLRYVSTEEVNIEGIDGDMSIIIKIDPGMGDIKLEPDSVRLKIILGRQQ